MRSILDIKNAQLGHHQEYKYYNKLRSKASSSNQYPNHVEESLKVKMSRKFKQFLCVIPRVSVAISALLHGRKNLSMDNGSKKDMCKINNDGRKLFRSR